MATSSDMNPGYEPLEADLCITKSWQRDQVMGITFMVQTKKKKKKVYYHSKMYYCNVVKPTFSHGHFVQKNKKKKLKPPF